MHPADVQTMLSTLNYVDDTEPEEDPERIIKGRTSRTSAKAAEEAAQLDAILDIEATDSDGSDSDDD